MPVDHTSNAKPTFNNRENEEVKTEDGRTVWLSRSCAVVAYVCLFNLEDKRWYTLLGKRGTGVPDAQGHWGLTCGYLDWDENLHQAMLREVWEECGLDLTTLSQSEQFLWSGNPCLERESKEETPWSISDLPKVGKQNISFHYSILFGWRGQPLPSLSIENAAPNEVEQLAWVPIEEAVTMDLAFNHATRLKQMCEERAKPMRLVETNCS
ncbi:MAG: hypothetical protein COA42_21375 [Alteromonadaceae bacterium]|nr:MAG: hypothetical protein COA42_21375 [Alteromonadaceae bacterium]